MSTFHVDQRVRLVSDIYEHASGDAPGGYLAFSGEIVIVQNVFQDTCKFNIAVSHEHITDRSFVVNADEIEALEDTEDSVRVRDALAKTDESRSQKGVDLDTPPGHQP